MHCGVQTKAIHEPVETQAGARRPARRIAAIAAAGLILGLGAILVPAPAAASYVVTDLVSDIPGRAAFTDANLVNPWD